MRDLLEITNNILIVGEADTVAAARAVVKQPELDIVFLDVNLPDRSGFQAPAPLPKRIRRLGELVPQAVNRVFPIPEVRKPRQLPLLPRIERHVCIALTANARALTAPHWPRCTVSEIAL